MKLLRLPKRLAFVYLELTAVNIYVHNEIPELINLQNNNGKAVPYQVKQLLQFIERYNLQMGSEM